MCNFFDKRGRSASVVPAGHHRAQQMDRQSALQTSQRENNDRILFTLTFQLYNQAVKSIILKNFKLLQNDLDTGRIFSQPPLTSFKHDKNTHTHIHIHSLLYLPSDFRVAYSANMSKHLAIRLTNRFHVAVHLSFNRSQMTSKCGKNKKVAHEAIAECVTDVLTTF